MEQYPFHEMEGAYVFHEEMEGAYVFHFHDKVEMAVEMAAAHVFHEEEENVFHEEDGEI